MKLDINYTNNADVKQIEAFNKLIDSQLIKLENADNEQNMDAFHNAVAVIRAALKLAWDLEIITEYEHFAKREDLRDIIAAYALTR